MSEHHTFYCDTCQTVVHLMATNRNAALRVECFGRWTPEFDSHEPTMMRMIGTLRPAVYGEVDHG